MNKRSAAASIIERSLRPAGYVRETFAGKTAHRLTPQRIQALRDFIAQSARDLDVPGVGIALIDQGKVVWQGGVGVRELGSAAPVDARTKFMIASNTKGMSTLLLSVLADEGRLRWDQKVTDLYPSFRLGSDATTKATLVRNLVCACTGLPRKDYAFILADSGAPASDKVPAALGNPAHQPLWRVVPVQQSDGGGRRLPGRLRSPTQVSSSALPTTRPCRPGSSGRSGCMTRLSTSRSGRVATGPGRMATMSMATWSRCRTTSII